MMSSATRYSAALAAAGVFAACGDQTAPRGPKMLYAAANAQIAQVAAPGTAVAAVPTVRVEIDGTPIANVQVTFTVTAMGSCTCSSPAASCWSRIPPTPRRSSTTTPGLALSTSSTIAAHSHGLGRRSRSATTPALPARSPFKSTRPRATSTSHGCSIRGATTLNFGTTCTAASADEAAAQQSPEPRHRAAAHACLGARLEPITGSSSARLGFDWRVGTQNLVPKSSGVAACLDPGWRPSVRNESCVRQEHAKEGTCRVVGYAN